MRVSEINTFLSLSTIVSIISRELQNNNGFRESRKEKEKGPQNFEKS